MVLLAGCQDFSSERMLLSNIPANDDSDTTTDGLGDISSNQSTEECTSRQDRDDERLMGTSELLDTLSFDDVDEDR